MADDLPAGDRVGRYRIEGPLGSGGAGRVYVATDVDTGEKVAIKCARGRVRVNGQSANDRTAGEESTEQSLRQEAEVLRCLKHPAAPRLIGASERPFFCLMLGLIEGMDLERYLTGRGGRLAQPEFVELLLELADVVGAIHDHGFLHGDLKPSNVIVGPDGHASIVDFGAARTLAAAQDETTTRMLTPGYSAPECHRPSHGAVGRWSDVYSLGAVAYRVATGRHPVSAEARVRGAAMPATAEIGAGTYAFALCAAIDWALEIAPEDRPQSAQEWAATVRAAAAAVDEEAPTLFVRRRSVSTSKAPAPAPEAAARSFVGSRRRARALAYALLMASMLGVSGWAAHLYYHRYVKDEWVVDAAGGGDMVMIGEALARARDGATIVIRPGIYEESLEVGRPVTILGAVDGDRRPTIRPKGGHCIRVTAPRSHLSGLVLQGPDSAEGGEAPLCLEVSGGEATVASLAIAAPAGTAIAVTRGGEVRLLDSVVSGSGAAAVSVASGAKVEITGSEIHNAAEAGILARGGASVTVDRTIVRGAGQAGLFLAEGARGRIQGSAIAGSRTSGIEVAGAAEAAVVDSVVEASAEAGIFIRDAGQATLERVRVTKNGLSGIVVTSTGAVRAIESIIQENGEHGVLVLAFATGTVDRSQVTGNSGHGIVAFRTATVEATGSTVAGNREPQVVETDQP